MRATPIAGEHPLTLYVDKQEVLTLMTLGAAPEALAIGWLRNQRLVKGIEDIEAVQVDWETDSVAVTSNRVLKGVDKKLQKKTVTTGCGQGTVYGDLMEEIDSVKLRDDVKLAFVHRGVGGITENDISLAAATNATLIGFNVRPDRKARDLAESEGVEIRTYEIIYKLLEDIERAMVGMLAPEFEEVVTGEAEVREIFRVPRIGAIAGCLVRTGVITRGSKVRFLRDGTIIWKGSIQSLKRFKEDAREVREGFECGIGLSDFQDLKPGDLIETFEEREIARV